jgi:uncharacterized membrane protein YdjX (TVP38/TMEM64 family)
MNEKIKNKIKVAFSLIVIVLVFIFVSYIIQANLVDLRFFSENKILAVVIYMLILITEVIFLPINTYPLIPFASNLFGWIPTAIYSLIGWTIGSFIAFFIAQEYGKPLLERIVPLEKIEKFQKRVPQKNFFWSVVFLRIFFPLDIMSYALGFFTKIKKTTYIFATLIGYAPLSFAVAYLGTISFYYQIIGAIIGGLILLIGGWLIIRRSNKNYRRE